MYNIYSNTIEGREHVGTCNSRAKEALEAAYQGLEFEGIDTEDLPIIHKSKQDSAKNLIFALAIGGTGLLLALVIELI